MSGGQGLDENNERGGGEWGKKKGREREERDRKKGEGGEKELRKGEEGEG